MAAASANLSRCRSASSFSIASRSSLLRRPTARGLYFNVGLAGSPGPPGAGVFAAGPMLPDGVRFFKDCSRWTGGLLAEGPALAFSPGAGVAEFELGSVAFVRRFAAAADAPRRGAALGGMVCDRSCFQSLYVYF